MTSNAPGPEAPRSLADLRALIIDIDGVLWRGDTALPGLAAFFAFMRERGILISTDGPFHNVLKIKPPMVFNTGNAALLVETLDSILSETALR